MDNEEEDEEWGGVEEGRGGERMCNPNMNRQTKTAQLNIYEPKNRAFLH